MPIYEYECTKCNSRVEVFQKITDKPPSKCKKCGGKMEKQLSAPAIQFKGSGWYVTDYPSESRKKAMSQEKSSGDGKSTETSTASTTTEKVSSTESKT